FPDGTFDLVFSIYVLEHIPDPRAFAGEMRRLLRPGGIFMALTQNLYHYVSMISALTPEGFHKWVNLKRGRAEEDTFPTFYRLNTRSALTRHFTAAGFEFVSLETIEVQPSYLLF